MKTADEIAREAANGGRPWLSGIKAARLAQIDALEWALQTRERHGHNDTCDGQLVAGTGCSCGYGEVAVKLRELKGATSAATPAHPRR